jgi:predicted RNA polymerase sigma factor
MDRSDAAAAAYRRALDLTANEPERAFLQRRLAGISGTEPS